jgi:hypothetical protein
MVTPAGGVVVEVEVEVDVVDVLVDVVDVLVDVDVEVLVDVDVDVLVEVVPSGVEVVAAGTVVVGSEAGGAALITVVLGAPSPTKPGDDDADGAPEDAAPEDNAPEDSAIGPPTSSTITGPPPILPPPSAVIATRRWSPSSDMEKSLSSEPGTEPDPVWSSVARSKRWMPVVVVPSACHCGVAR